MKHQALVSFSDYLDYWQKKENVVLLQEHSVCYTLLHSNKFQACNIVLIILLSIGVLSSLGFCEFNSTY